MNRLHCIALLLLGSNLLLAQEFTVSLEDKLLKTKNFPYVITRVTDARAQPYAIGIAKTGLNNRRVPAFSKNELSFEIAQLFKRSLGTDTSGHPPLIVRINQLFVYESPVSAEQAFLEISLSFLKAVPDGYMELATIGATSVKGSGLDVSHKHDDNIVAGIDDCLQTFLERAQLGLLNSQLLPEAGLHELPIPYAFSMMQTGPNKAGVYHTFSDFLNNTPNENPGIPIVMKEFPGKGKRATYYKLEDGKKLQESLNIWGVSDGKDAYALVSGTYYRIKRSGDSLLLMLPGPVNADEAIGAAVIGGLVGGIIGGAIVGAIAAGKEGPATLYQIDLLTSSLTPVDLPNSRRMEARVVLFCSEFAKSPITVRLDGKELCTLEKGTYQRLRLPPPEREITLTLESNGKTTEKKIKPELLDTEVCLLRVVKGEPKLDSPTGETRLRLLRQIRDGEVQERCKQ